MNAYERVMKTLQGQPTDRVPVFAVLGAYGGKLTGTDLRTLYSDASAYVAGQRAVQEAFGLDMVLAPFDYSAIGEAFGGEVAWFERQAPNLKRAATTKATAALALPLPDPQRSGRLPVILSATRQLVEIYRDQVPVFASVPGPCVFPSLLLGLEGWMDALMFDEANAARLLEHTGRFFVAWANALFEAGVTGLVIPEAMAPAEIMPRSLFADRMLPHLKTMFAQIRGPMVFHHAGGRITQILDLLPGLPGMIGVAISSKDNLAEARRLLGPELLLLGNLDNLSYPAASPGQMRERSLACLQAAAPAGRYILANSGADIPMNTVPENIRAMLESSEAYAAGERIGS